MQSGDCFVNNDSQSEELASVIRRPEASRPGQPGSCILHGSLAPGGSMSLGWGLPCLGYSWGGQTSVLVCFRGWPPLSAFVLSLDTEIASGSLKTPECLCLCVILCDLLLG